MSTLNVRKVLILLSHAFIGWVLCTLTMFIGMAIATMETALIAHAVGAPIIFFFVSFVYFTRFNYTSPIQTALVFVGFVIFMDFFLVALIINKSLEMFTSVLGTRLPFTLIFLSTYATGLAMSRQQRSRVPST